MKPHMLFLASIALVQANPSASADPLKWEPDRLDKQKKRAADGCAVIAKAVKAYIESPSNPAVENEDLLPLTPQCLVEPGWLPTGFLPNGKKDLEDPWGKKYQFQKVKADDGTVHIVIHTRAPDGTKISQFGTGEKSRVP